MSNETKATTMLWLRAPNLPFQRMDEDTIVIDPRSRDAHLMNETAARIWELLETATSLDEICATLAEEYEGAEPAALRGEVEAFMNELFQKGLLASRGRA